MMKTSTDLFEIKQNSFRPESWRSSLQHKVGTALISKVLHNKEKTKNPPQKSSSYAQTQNTPHLPPKKMTNQSTKRSVQSTLTASIEKLRARNPRETVKITCQLDVRRAEIRKSRPDTDQETAKALAPFFAAANSGYNLKRRPKYLRISFGPVSRSESSKLRCLYYALQPRKRKGFF